MQQPVELDRSREISRVINVVQKEVYRISDAINLFIHNPPRGKIRQRINFQAHRIIDYAGSVAANHGISSRVGNRFVWHCYYNGPCSGVQEERWRPGDGRPSGGSTGYERIRIPQTEQTQCIAFNFKIGQNYRDGNAFCLTTGTVLAGSHQRVSSSLICQGNWTRYIGVIQSCSWRPCILGGSVQHRCQLNGIVLAQHRIGDYLREV